MLATAGGRVLIYCRAVEARQSVLIPREVAWNPIHNHADAVPVAMIPEVAKIVGITMPTRGRVIACGLITRRLGQRVFGDRKRRYMGKTKFRRVFNHLVRQLPVTQPAAVIVAPP